MRTIRFITIVLILGILAALSGCGGGHSTTGGTAGITVAVQFPALQKTMPGSTTRVTIHILNEDKTKDIIAPVVAPRTSDAQETVQTTVTGLPAGPCWVRALAYDPNHTEVAIAGAEKQVYIVSGETQSVTLDMDLVPARISLSPNEIALYVGGILSGRPIEDPRVRQIMAICYDLNDNEIPGRLIWTSSKPEVATVNQSGIVIAVAPGTNCIITATDTLSGAQASASVWVGTYAN